MFLTLEQVRIHAAEKKDLFFNTCDFVEKIRYLHCTRKLRMSGVPCGEPYSYPVNPRGIGERGEIMPSVWNDFYPTLEAGGKFVCMDPEYECVEIRDVRVNHDNVLQIWPNRKAVQILGKTQPERIASWLSQTYDARPADLTVDQLLGAVQKADTLGGASKPSLERALKMLGWQMLSPRAR